MSAVSRALALGLCTLAVACADNRTNGNDREAHLDPPRPAAEVMSGDEAIRNLPPDAVLPEAMTYADLTAAALPGPSCVFRMTRVDHAAMVYGPREAVLKVNGKLARLPGVDDGRYGNGRLSVVVGAVEESRSESWSESQGTESQGAESQSEELFLADMVLHLTDAPHERGFRGYAQCTTANAPNEEPATDAAS